MELNVRKVTLDEQLSYRLAIAGALEAEWSEWIDATIVVATVAGVPVSTITGRFDQAALHGILRRLYSLGFPLISVNRDYGSTMAHNKTGGLE